MFTRDYVEYHSTRFEDHSLLFFKGERLIGIMPANLNDQRLETHGGLSFGGIVVDFKMTVGTMLESFEALRDYCNRHSISQIRYKAIPRIYHKAPAEEDLYALFRNGAQLRRRDASAVVQLSSRQRPITKGRKHSIGRAAKSGLMLRESNDFSHFWALLTNSLGKRHGAKPTHSLDEITYLASVCSKQITLYEAVTRDAEFLAGAVIFEEGAVAHTQYLTNSDEGRDAGALDWLIAQLIDHYSEKEYLSFGISTEMDGLALNHGLARYKEGFGARTTVIDHYTMDISEAPPHR